MNITQENKQSTYNGSDQPYSSINASESSGLGADSLGHNSLTHDKTFKHNQNDSLNSHFNPNEVSNTKLAQGLHAPVSTGQGLDDSMYNLNHPEGEKTYTTTGTTSSHGFGGNTQKGNLSSESYKNHNDNVNTGSHGLDSKDINTFKDDPVNLGQEYSQESGLHHVGDSPKYHSKSETHPLPTQSLDVNNLLKKDPRFSSNYDPVVTPNETHSITSSYVDSHNKPDNSLSHNLESKDYGSHGSNLDNYSHDSNTTGHKESALKGNDYSQDHSSYDSTKPNSNIGLKSSQTDSTLDLSNDHKNFTTSKEELTIPGSFPTHKVDTPIPFKTSGAYTSNTSIHTNNLSGTKNSDLTDGKDFSKLSIGDNKAGSNTITSTLDSKNQFGNRIGVDDSYGLNSNTSNLTSTNLKSAHTSFKDDDSKHIISSLHPVNNSQLNHESSKLSDKKDQVIGASIPLSNPANQSTKLDNPQHTIGSKNNLDNYNQRSELDGLSSHKTGTSSHLDNSINRNHNSSLNQATSKLDDNIKPSLGSGNTLKNKEDHHVVGQDPSVNHVTKSTVNSAHTPKPSTTSSSVLDAQDKSKIHNTSASTGSHDTSKINDTHKSNLHGSSVLTGTHGTNSNLHPSDDTSSFLNGSTAKPSHSTLDSTSATANHNTAQNDFDDVKPSKLGGTFDKIKGSIKEKIGKVTNNVELEAEGVHLKLEGEAKIAAAKAETSS